MMMSRSKPTKSDKIRALIKQGATYTEISKKLKCSYQLVWTVANNDANKTVDRRKASKSLQKAKKYLDKAIEELK
jgi:DNA invertase Pin-like site-specific DNA recombinase